MQVDYDKTMNYLDKSDTAMNKVNDILENPLLNKIYDKVIKDNLIDEDDPEFNANVYTLLYMLTKDRHKEQQKDCVENNKENSKYHNIIGTIALINPYAAIAYLGYKGLAKLHNNTDKIKKVKKNIDKNRRQFKIFIYLYTKLGFEEKMKDVNYIPTQEEVEELQNMFKIKTNGGSLVELLEMIYN